MARLVPLPSQALELETSEARPGADAAPECDCGRAFLLRVTRHQKKAQALKLRVQQPTEMASGLSERSPGHLQVQLGLGV